MDVIHSQPIAVADGSELKCQYVCHNFTWRLQNTKFCSDVLLIPLGSCDMVLGIQWLSQLGTIQWNFNTLHMEFSWAGKRHVLRGLQGPRVKIIQGIHLPQALKEGFNHACCSLYPLKIGCLSGVVSLSSRMVPQTILVLYLTNMEIYSLILLDCPLAGGFLTTESLFTLVLNPLTSGHIVIL